MSYLEKIQELSKSVPISLVDFELPREKARTPTQASSNFITNREQGDWAENLILKAINETSNGYVAVKYGKSDSIIAGEVGFDKFYQEFQNELDTIGKRPDILIFKKDDFISDFGYDISHIPHSRVTNYVKEAIAAIEVRSSSFLIDKYESSMYFRTKKHTEETISIRDQILENYSDLLEHPNRQKYFLILKALNLDTFSIADFKVPGWSSTDRLYELNAEFKKLKKSMKEIQKRDYLSITVKVEDLKVVYKWIEAFNVPHFYFQVFFDKVYGISFSEILETISDSNKEGVVYTIEKDTKNQNKTTIKINSKTTTLIANKVDEPSHKSVRKEMDRGRLLFYVTFKGGSAYLDVENFRNILGIMDK